MTRPASDGRLTGFRNVARKDLREWLATPRGLATLFGSTTYGVMAMLGPLLGRALGRRDPNLPLDPTAIFAASGWLTIVPLALAFATLSMLVAERDRGTMAWSLSKPLTRDAFLASKVLTGAGMVLLLGIALPMAATAIAAWIAYGSPPDPALVGWTFVGAGALAIFYVALQFTASAFAWSQAASALIVIGTMFLAQALVAIDPRLYDVMPLAIGDWFVRLGHGAAGTLATPLAYVALVIGPLAVARRHVARIEV